MLSAELVIAADGANSAIRTLLNIPIETQHYGEDALVTTVDATQLTHTAYERFTAKGVIAILPISDTRAVLIWTGPSEWIAHLRQMDLQVFLKTLQTYFGYRAGKLTNPGKFHVYPLQLIVAQKIVQDGVVLIGHAAHTLHPLAAQGFNLSLRDISTLAEMIETRISTGKALFDLQWLKAYSQLRESDQKTIIRLTHRLRDLFSQDLFPLKAARSLGLSACDLFPPIKSALARKAMGIAGRLPRAD
jgi:2-octaprenyl-6-methoxyphenol hydroxylase